MGARLGRAGERMGWSPLGLASRSDSLFVEQRQRLRPLMDSQRSLPRATGRLTQRAQGLELVHAASKLALGPLSAA